MKTRVSSLKTQVSSINTRVSSIKNEHIRRFLLIQLKLEALVLILDTRVLNSSLFLYSILEF